MACFFYLVGGPDKEAALIDLFAVRYGWNTDIIGRLDVVTMYDLLRTIKEENERKKLREEWLAQLPFMAVKMLKYTDFEAYAGQRMSTSIDRRPTQEILAEVEEVRRAIQNG